MASSNDIEKIDIKVTTSPPVKGKDLEVPDEYWAQLFDHAHDTHRIYFGHENDDQAEIRTVKLTAGDEKYEWLCELRSSCHEGEHACLYFRCITKEGDLSGLTSYPVSQTQYFIVIPDRANGNTRLKVKGDRLVAMTPGEDGEKGIPDLDEKAAWKYLENYLEDLVIEHFKKKGMGHMLEENVKALDKLAGRLQDAGMYEEALAVDTIANTIESSDVGPRTSVTPDEAVRDLRSAVLALNSPRAAQVSYAFNRAYGPQYGEKLFNIARDVAANPASMQQKQQEWQAVYNQTLLQGRYTPVPTPAVEDDVFLPRAVTPKYQADPNSPFLKCASSIRKIASQVLKDLKRKELYKEAYELWSILESMKLD